MLVSAIFIKAAQESLLGLVPRIKCQSHTVITIWYHIACNRALALRDTLFVNFILQTLAGKCGSREFWEWKLKGDNESFIGRYIGGKTWNYTGAKIICGRYVVFIMIREWLKLLPEMISFSTGMGLNTWMLRRLWKTVGYLNKEFFLFFFLLRLRYFPVDTE